MKFLGFLKKAFLTAVLVKKHLPDVLKELKDLTGATFLFINELKNIWKL